MLSQQAVPYKLTFIVPLRWLVTRAMVFYLVVLGGIMALVDHQRIAFGLKVRILDNLIPESFLLLIDLEKKDPAFPAPPDLPEKLLPYMNFYQKVTQLFPEQADAQAMLGFCFAVLGQDREAAAAYGRARELNKNVFWFPYNLGILHLKSGDYAKAGEFFQEALEVSADDTRHFVASSTVIYRSILMHDPNWPQALDRRIEIGYRNAVVLAALCWKNLGQEEKALNFLRRARLLQKDREVSLGYDLRMRMF